MAEDWKLLALGGAALRVKPTGYKRQLRRRAAAPALSFSIGSSTHRPRPLLPQSLKSSTGHTRVMHGVFRIAMAEVVLHGPQIDARVRKLVAARMAQHVWVHILQAGTIACDTDQIVDRLSRHRLPALGDKNPRELVGARCEIALDRAQLITGDRLLD